MNNFYNSPKHDPESNTSSQNPQTLEHLIKTRLKWLNASIFNITPKDSPPRSTSRLSNSKHKLKPAIPSYKIGKRGNST